MDFKFWNPSAFFSRVRPWIIWLAGSFVLLGIFWVSAFSIDSYLISSNNTARNLKLGSYEAGGISRSSLERLVTGISNEEAKRQVTLFLPEEKQISVTLSDIGIKVDVPATIDAALDARKGSLPLRIFSWSKSFIDTDKIDIEYIATSEINSEAISTLYFLIEEPKSAGFSQSESYLPLQLESESLGRTIDTASIVKGALALINHGIPEDESLGIELETSPIYPEVRNAGMRMALDEINRKTSVGIDTLLDGEVRRLTPEAYRESLEYSYNAETQKIDANINIEIFQKNLELLYADFVKQGRSALYSIDETDTPQLSVEGINLGCCSRVNEEEVNGLLDGEKILQLETIVVDDQLLEEYEALQISEKVGSFSTNFFPDQARAVNIFIAAEAIRGEVIFPGDTWSMNEQLGSRSAAKGYLAAENNYYFQTILEYGGGAEQLATTLFNAAVLAGLEIPSYEPHTIDLSEYPLGLNATLSWPTPDLIIHNSTPYGILIWTKFNRGSISVDLYGMKFYETIEVSPPQVFFIGGCREIVTDRTRIDIDGNELIDSFEAFYYPDQGINCDGTSFLEGSAESAE